MLFSEKELIVASFTGKARPFDVVKSGNIFDGFRLEAGERASYTMIIVGTVAAVDARDYRAGVERLVMTLKAVHVGRAIETARRLLLYEPNSRFKKVGHPVIYNGVTQEHFLRFSATGKYENQRAMRKAMRRMREHERLARHQR